VSVTRDPENTLCISEYREEQCLLELTSLFGIDNTHKSTHIALTKVNTLAIHKRFVIDELMNFWIFRLNYLNMISNRASRLHARLWERAPQSAEEKLRRFFLDHVEYPKGEKLIEIGRRTLAKKIQVPVSQVTQALKEMEGQEALQLTPKGIRIPDMTLL